jgi:uncharacterized membrane protein YfcA
MFNDVGLISLISVTFLAATVNGGLGYGFSSLTVPVALVFYANRVLNPALVLVEVALNCYLLFLSRKSVPLAWRRVVPILVGLTFGVIGGSQLLSVAHPEWLKLFTYAVVLPLILFQAAGVRRPIRSERLFGVPFGAGVGALYSLTTISGPPLALLFNNQGYVKEEFRAALGIIRVAESSLTAIAYYWLGLYSADSTQILVSILPSVALGVPLGAFVIRQMPPENFRRICMSFDAWIVGFGLSRVLLGLQLLTGPAAYSLWVAVIMIDAYLLYLYFGQRQKAIRVRA